VKPALHSKSSFDKLKNISGMKYQKIIPVLVTLLVLMLPSMLHAQGPDPGGDPDAAVPIDGGLSILLAAGVGYVAKKGYDKRKKEQKTD
jgi:predicted metal-dependent HD superfamily phosphohydrolase